MEVLLPAEHDGHVKHGHMISLPTEEEKAMWYRKLQQPDLSRAALASGFASFTLPTTAEGFDEIRFAWQDESTCATVMKDWVLLQKKTQRVEDLKPSAWFDERWDAWQKQLQEWKKVQNDAKHGRTNKKKETEKKKSEEDRR